jgi:hypothetical protein
MFCDQCGTELQSAQNFCPKCGKPLGTSVGAPMPSASRFVRNSAHRSIDVPARNRFTFTTHVSPRLLLPRRSSRKSYWARRRAVVGADEPEDPSCRSCCCAFRASSVRG